MNTAVKVIEAAVACGSPSQVVTLNAEMVFQARDNPSLTEILSRALLVTPDGIGVVWALRRNGYAVKQRVAGIDLATRLLELGGLKGWKFYLLGAEPHIVSSLDQHLTARYSVEIVGTHHGYFSEDESPLIVDAINKAKPDILLVALGAPKQEYWISTYQSQLKVPVSIGVGGTFDVWAGKVSRAPQIWRKLNLEWLYRLLSEPKRLKRQMVLPKFVLMVLMQRNR